MPLDPCQGQALDSFENQTRRTSYPYYSKVKLVARRDGDPPGPYTYLVPTGHEVRAFAYAVGDPRQVAGYTVNDGVATIADTNQSDRNKTTGGQNLIVHGIALQLLDVAFHAEDGQALPHMVYEADWKFVAALWNSMSVEVILNGGENVFKLGVPGMVPGAGGLVGGLPTLLKDQALAGMPRSQPYATNSWAVRNNFFRLPEGLVWRNQSNADSMFNLRFVVQRAIELYSGGNEENAKADSTYINNDTVATAVPGYVFPPKLCVEIMAFLVGEVVGPRTRSA
jgi:hypothetical protein